MSGDMETFPTATFFRGVFRINSRIPPIASKASIPCKIATMSHSKLQQEASSPTPDLRRCVGHHAVFCRSMEAAQEARRRQMDHLSYEDEPDYETQERSEIDVPAIREQVTRTVKAMIRRRSTSTSHVLESEKTGTLVRVSAHESRNHDVVQTAPEKKRKFASRSRKYVSMLVPGRRTLTHPSPMLHANAVY